MKQTVLILLAFLLLTVTASSQESSDPYIKGYKGGYEFFFFDSINKLYVSELACLDSMYHCFVTFKVGVNANITDFQVVEIPISKLPPLVKTYLEKVFKASNGNWIPKIKEGSNVVSDEIVYRIDIAKENQSIKESMAESERFAEYFLVVAPSDTIINKLVRAKDWKWLGIRY